MDCDATARARLYRGSRLKKVLGVEANLLLVMLTIFVQGAKILKLFPKKNFFRKNIFSDVAKFG